MKTLVTLVAMCCFGLSTYAQEFNQPVIDKGVELLSNDLKTRGDYNSCVFLSEEEFVASAKVYITEYASQISESEDPAEIAALAKEAIVFAVEQVVLDEGLYIENFLECQANVIESFVPAEGTEPIAESSGDSWPEQTEEEEEEEYIEPEKTEIPDFVIDFPTYVPNEIVDQVDNISLWVNEIENGRPSIIFATNDELDSVKAFFIEELPDYYQVTIDDMLVLSEQPFDVRDLYTQEGREKWFQMKSVWIEPNLEYADVFPGLVKIEIHY